MGSSKKRESLLQKHYEKTAKEYDNLIAEHGPLAAALGSGKRPTKAYVAKELLKNFADKLHGNEYLELRNIIFMVHMIVESMMDYAITINHFPKGDEASLHLMADDVIHKIDFAKKVRIIEEKGIYDKVGIGALFRLNDLRVACAHARLRIKESFRYHGKTIFDQRFHEALWEDYEAVIWAHTELTDRLQDK